MDDEVYEALEDWAEEEGFTMQRAWYEIVKEGLESVGAMNS